MLALTATMWHFGHLGTLGTLAPRLIFYAPVNKNFLGVQHSDKPESGLIHTFRTAQPEKDTAVSGNTVHPFESLGFSSICHLLRTESLKQIKGRFEAHLPCLHENNLVAES